MKRIGKYVYIIYIVFCITLLFIKHKDGEGQIQIDQYGIETDSTIELSEEKQIEANFTLTNDHLEGLSVKFQSDYAFQNEQIKAVLYDANTGDILAEDIVELKYEMIRNKDYGSFIYFSLPVSSGKGKDVKIDFSLVGEEIFVYPRFVVSDGKILSSELVIDGEKEDQNLVFSTRYNLGTSNSYINIISEGIFWILIGTVLFYLYCNRNKKLYPQGTKDGNENLKSGRFKKQFFSKNNKKALGFFLSCFLMIIFLVYVYQYGIEKVLVKQKEVSVFKQDTSGTICIDENTKKISQTFLCEYDKVSGLIVPYSIEKVGDQAAVHVKVKDNTTGLELADKVLTVPRSKREREELYIDFHETLVKGDNHILEIEIIPEHWENTIINSLLLSNEPTEVKGKDSRLLFNGKSLEAVMDIKIECENTDYLKILYIVLSGMLFFALLISYILCCVKKIKIHKIFLPLAVCFGTIFSCVIGLYTVPDEPSHIDTAYQLSNEILGVPDSPKPGYIYKRADDIDPLTESKQSLNVYSYERLFKQLFSKVKDDTLIECSVSNNFSNAGRVFYYPQAMGISFGRIFGLGTMPTMMLGRIVALIIYAILTSVAIKKIPLAKASLFLIGLLPISLQQAASFSYDAMINGVSFLYVGYALAFLYDEEFGSNLDTTVLLISGSLLASVKGGVYLPLCFLPLISLSKKTRKNFVYVGCIVGVFILFFAKYNLLNTIIRLTADQGTMVGGAANQEIYTLSYILNHPLQFIGMFFHTFYKQGDSYIRNLLGGNLAWRDINISWTIIFAFGLVVLLSCLGTQKKNADKILRSEKVGFGIISLSTFGLIELSMLFAWTPITYLYITGVQGRYFLPFFPLVLIIFRNTFIKIEKNIDKILIFSICILDILTILQVVQRALE